MSETTGLFLSVTEGGTGAAHTPLPPLSVLAGPATGPESNLVRSAIFPIACWRIGDIRFHFDSSFVVAEARGEFQALSRLIKDNTRQLKPPPLSVFGHTDPTGNDEYNKALAGRRAVAIYAALTRRTEIWEDLFSNTGKFAHDAPGDQWGDAAVGAMRSALGRTETGKTTAGQRQSLFLQYMDFLCIDDQLKPFRVDPVQGFLGANGDALGKGDYQGCSEFNPILLVSRADKKKFDQQKDHTERDTANAPNRRVMVLLFRPGSRITPSLWPCPRAKESTAGCRKRLFSDAEKRRSNGETQREFKDKEDTFACRFYQRLVTRSPCERGDKAPLVVARFDTLSGQRDSTVQLVVFDGSGSEVRVIPGQRATDTRDGFFLFRFDPTELPDPVRLEWRTSEGEFHLAGPCSPSELRDALAGLDLNKGHALVGSGRPDDDPPSPPTPPNDDVLVELITEGADGQLA
jgi:hypothetical protein